MLTGHMIPVVIQKDTLRFNKENRLLQSQRGADELVMTML